MFKNLLRQLRVIFSKLINSLQHTKTNLYKSKKKHTQYFSFVINITTTIKTMFFKESKNSSF